MILNSALLVTLALQPPADGQADPPDPQARPSEGVYAVGSSALAPLPPAPAPVPRASISPGVWRGQGWISTQLSVIGAIAGVAPARPTVVALGTGLDFGWRARPWIGLGMSVSRQPHEVYLETQNDGSIQARRGSMTSWDIGLLRLWAPVPGRIVPYADLGLGLGVLNPARGRALLAGATVRGAVGLELWIGRSLTLGVQGLYRANIFGDTVGHTWQAGLTLASHW